jgi:hypothetical protein
MLCHLQGLKILKKNIFNVLEANLDENLILKKKSQNLPPNNEILDIFKILKLVWWAEMADGRLKIGLYFFVTKIFFISKHQKFTILIYKNIPPKKALFEGGGVWKNLSR